MTLFNIFIMLMNTKLSIDCTEEMSLGTQARPDFPGDLENLICILILPTSSSTFHLPHLKEEHLHLCINMFYQKPPNCNSNLSLHLDSGPPNPAAFLLVKSSVNKRVLKLSNLFQFELMKLAVCT